LRKCKKAPAALDEFSRRDIIVLALKDEEC